MLSGSQGRSFRIRHAKSLGEPPSGEFTMTSYPACNKTSLSWKPCIANKKLLWNAIRKWSLIQNPVTKNRVERPLVEKSRWRQIRLAIKPRYLGNHASQTKCYYGTLSGSHGRSFNIRHEKSREAPPGGGLTMTSCPVGNKISLSRKPSIVDKKFLWITIMKSWLQSNFSKKIANINFKNLSVHKCC